MEIDSKLTSRKRLWATLTTVLLIASFCIVLIAGGHGAAPIGYLLVAGGLLEWGFRMLLAWIGISVTVFGALSAKTVLHFRFAVAGLVCASEMRGLTLLTSLPFLSFVTIRGLFLMRIKSGAAKKNQGTQPTVSQID
jgi:hypothetical protein